MRAAPESVWRTVADPHHLPRWWPRVVRVEGVSGDAFTEILQSDRGATVRADFSFLDRRAPQFLRWRQEIEGTPFERMLSSSVTAVSLKPADGGTNIELRLDQRLRGVARFGGLIVRRAAARQLDGALAGLDRVHGDTDGAV